MGNHLSQLAGAPVLLAALCAALQATSAASATTEIEPQALHRRASTCVAVMKPRAGALADRYRGGETDVQAELLKLTEAGFAFIASAYKAGLRKPEAEQLLAEAERSQQGLAAAELARLFAGCRDEGDRLLTESNVFERALVAQQARARLRKLTDDTDRR